ncbi:ELMO domain-containing protein F [Lucilia cuprina]|uniref:ELMO domain-containing protein F n=1 Tax=Lucilia cuprina TaxID=7375 RepID=UPI001F05C4E9|nr:ELMO domain-containing protein F [Lucilia cuprina]
MAPNETSALLKNYREQNYPNNGDRNNNNNNNNNGGTVVVGGYHAMDDKNHIVYVNKDASEYEPIFCINDYTSSLTLDELLPYQLDPWWQNLRSILFLIFWLTLLLTFLTACLLSYLQLGHVTCNVVEKQLLTTNPIEVSSFSASSSILAEATTLSTTIAQVLSTEILGGTTLSMTTVP